MKRAVALVLVACAVLSASFSPPVRLAAPACSVTLQPRDRVRVLVLRCLRRHAALDRHPIDAEHHRLQRLPERHPGRDVYRQVLHLLRDGVRHYLPARGAGPRFRLRSVAEVHDELHELRVAGAIRQPVSEGPGVVDSTLLNNYEAADVVQASVGSWSNCSGGSSCTYTYQFQRCTGVSGTTGTGCTNIGSAPQCSATTATTCSYTLAPGDVGDYIVSSVMATNSGGTSAPAASQAVGAVVASRVNTFCNVSAAYTISPRARICAAGRTAPTPAIRTPQGIPVA